MSYKKSKTIQMRQKKRTLYLYIFISYVPKVKVISYIKGKKERSAQESKYVQMAEENRNIRGEKIYI